METELLGTPSVVLTTRPFVSQARAMSRMRGNPDYGLAIIDHPIVILTHEQLLEWRVGGNNCNCAGAAIEPLIYRQ